MKRFLFATLFAVTGLMWSTSTASAQWGHNHGSSYSGGHLDFHNGHIDYHQPSHYDYHNGHLDFHSGHIDHIVPQIHQHYPSTVYPTVISSTPVYSNFGTPTIVSSYPSTPVISGSSIVTTSPPGVSALKPPVVSSIVTNALPAVSSGPTTNSAPIIIRNPAKYTTPLTFKLNDQQVRLEPGQQTSITFDRSYVIEFDRGGQYGTQRYSMQDGSFEFLVGDRGWDLQRYTEAANVSPQLSNPLPTNPLPTNPLPPGGN